MADTAHPDKALDRFGGARALSRRGLLAGSLGIGGLWTLAACGGGVGADTGSVTATTKPKRGGTLRAAIPEEPFPYAYDMARVGSSTGTERVAYLAYNGLVNVDKTGKVVGELAETIENPSPTRYVFDLRKGVTFQDGTKLDANAVKANFDRIQDPKTASPRRLALVQAVNVLGPYQLEILLNQPYSAFLSQLRRNKIPIQSPTAVEKYAKTDPFKASVGTGGYSFVSYTKGDGVELARFNDYWGQTNYFDKISLKIIPSQPTALEALMSGEMDFIRIAPESVASIKGNPQVRLDAADDTFVDYLSFNQKVAPFDKLEVRQAFSQAIDRAGLVNAIYAGLAEAGHGPLATGFGSFYQPLTDVAAQKYDVAAAKASLAAGGYDKSSTIRFDSFTDAPFDKEADVIQQALSSIGVKTSLSKTDFTTFATLFYDQRKYTIGNSQWNGSVDPDEVLTNLYGPEDGTTSNSTSAIDPQMTQLIAAGRTTSDPGKRAEIYQEAGRRAAEQAYYAFICYPKVLAGLSTKVQGYKSRIGGGWPIDECWFA
ncbi:MAG TPA: ABC transporter substrate-binding protein [Rugosimonospora sp.]|jgi:peptide/nickel transport system substrate-binding protein